MPKYIRRTLVALVVGVAIYIYAVPICIIQRNLSRGNRVREELIASMKEQYPLLEWSGRCGYDGPHVWIGVKDQKGIVDGAEQLRIRDRLKGEKKKVDANIRASVEFEAIVPDKNGDLITTYDF